MTNDDKDLKPIFAGMKLLKMEYKDWVLKHSAHKIIDFQVDGFGFQRCYDCNEVYCYQDYFNLNTRPTPQQPSSKTAVQCSSCGHLDYIQQPSEPLKELDEQDIIDCIDFLTKFHNIHFVNIVGKEWNFSYWFKVTLAKEIYKKFGQLSEKKALSVEEIEKIIYRNHFKRYNGITPNDAQSHKTLAQAIESALPARKEVKWPEKMAEDGESDISIYDDQLEKRVVIGKRPNKRLDAIWFNKGIDACIAAYEEAMPAHQYIEYLKSENESLRKFPPCGTAQREVRYPEKKDTFNAMNDIFKAPNMGWNDAIDEMKKLNGG